MEGTLRSAITLFRPEAVAEEKSDYELIGEIRAIFARIRALETAFNLTLDPDLLECNMYEQLAMKAKYRYLLQRAKRQGLACPPELLGG